MKTKKEIENAASTYAKELIQSKAIKDYEQSWMEAVYAFVYNQALKDNEEKKFTTDQIKLAVDFGARQQKELGYIRNVDEEIFIKSLSDNKKNNIKYIQPENRDDNPHHYNNRQD